MISGTRQGEDHHYHLILEAKMKIVTSRSMEDFPIFQFISLLTGPCWQLVSKKSIKAPLVGNSQLLIARLQESRLRGTPLRNISSHRKRPFNDHANNTILGLQKGPNARHTSLISLQISLIHFQRPIALLAKPIAFQIFTAPPRHQHQNKI